MVVRSTSAGMTTDEFAKIAEEAEKNCPVSKLLDCEITLEANPNSVEVAAFADLGQRALDYDRMLRESLGTTEAARLEAAIGTVWSSVPWMSSSLP